MSGVLSTSPTEARMVVRSVIQQDVFKTLRKPISVQLNTFPNWVTEWSAIRLARPE